MEPVVTSPPNPWPQPSSVEVQAQAMLAENFNSLCQELRESMQTGPYTRLRSDSFSSGRSSSSRGSTSTAITDLYSGSAPRSPAHIPHAMQKAAFSHGTLPRAPKVQATPSCQEQAFTLSSPPAREGVSWGRTPGREHSPLQRRLSFSSHHLPQGFSEVERMYTAMKDLNTPLPHASMTSQMPALFPMHRSTDSLASCAASVLGEIPPPPPPVQSHAVLESGLGHTLPPSSIPRTPGLVRRAEGSWPAPPGQTFTPTMPLPPLPPKRTSSRISDIMRPNHLNLSQDSQDSIYARPRPFLHRSSLMSTGSSDSGASSGPSDPEPLSPLSPTSEHLFSWPHYTVGASLPSPTEHRSVSQHGDQDSGSEGHNTSIAARSDVYVRMNSVGPVFGQTVEGSPYMNLLYDAVQRQGGTGSVETAMSPYLEMSAAVANNTNLRGMRNVAVDSVSAIYAQIESSAVSAASEAGGPRPPSRGRGASSASAGGRTKRLGEFHQLMKEVEKKRHFRVGLNLFNTNPDIGIDYLVKQNFLELVPLSIAKFLYKNQGLAKVMVGHYLGHTESAFSMKVLSVFMEEFNFTGLRIDKALRQLLTYVKVPGEAAKIEKIMEVFGKRYNKCNPSFAAKLKSCESVLTIAFATMLLNTDLHNLDKKMNEKEFVTSLKAADDGKDFDSKLLKQIYKGVKKEAFSAGIDHVAQTNLLQGQMVGKAPLLAATHRRLVCLCRLAEGLDIQTKKEAEASNHARDIWLFNDTMILTKLTGKEKGKSVYTYKESFSLKGMEVTLFHTPVFQFGIQICRKTDKTVMATLNAESEQDRYKFVMDLQESIFEMDVMEKALREANLIK